MEALLIRIDMLRDRRQYVTILKQWLAELAIAHGRLVTMGDVHLLFIAAEAAKITQLLEFYATRTIDSNARGELCIDKFIDVVGRKSIESSGCKGFLEMNILNASMLEQMLVHEWHCDKEWLESALATPRTRALLAWREETKALRKDRRQKSAKERQVTKELKKKQQEQEAAEAAAKAAQARADAEAAADPEDSGSSTEDDSEAVRAKAAEQQQEHEQAVDDSDDGSAAVAPAAEPVATAKVPAPRRQQQQHKQQNQKQKQTKPQQQQQQKNAKRPHPQQQSHKRSKQQKKTHAK